MGKKDKKDVKEENGDTVSEGMKDEKKDKSKIKTKKKSKKV